MCIMWQDDAQAAVEGGPDGRADTHLRHDTRYGEAADATDSQDVAQTGALEAVIGGLADDRLPRTRLHVQCPAWGAWLVRSSGRPVILQVNDQALRLSRPVKKVRRGGEQACGAWYCVRPGNERGLQIHKEQAVHRRCHHRGIVSAWQTRSQHSWHTFAPDHRSCATARICERGSHAELMAAGGLYAELFELQARAYR